MFCLHLHSEFFSMIAKRNLFPLQSSYRVIQVQFKLYRLSVKKATVISFFVSRNIETRKATRLGGKKRIWSKKKVLRLPTSSSSSENSVFQALSGCFSLQHCGIMFHFCSKHQKLLEIEKRLCVRWLGVINSTWENLQIAKHKSVR